MHTVRTVLKLESDCCAVRMVLCKQLDNPVRCCASVVASLSAVRYLCMCARRSLYNNSIDVIQQDAFDGLTQLQYMYVHQHVRALTRGHWALIACMQ